MKKLLSVLAIIAAAMLIFSACDSDKGSTGTTLDNQTQPVPTPEKVVVKPALTNDQEKEVLYLAYSGIAYPAKGAKETNALYDVMFADLNDFVGEMFAATLANDFITPVGFSKPLQWLFDICEVDTSKIKFLNNKGLLLILGQSQTFVYKTDTFEASLAVSNDSAGVKETFQNMFKDFDIKKIKNQETLKTEFNKIIANLNQSYYKLKFVGNLSVKLNKTGYQDADVFYKSLDDSSEISARIEGVITAKAVGEKGKEKLGVVPELNSADIYIESVQARYAGLWVNYSNWEISYAVKEDKANIYLLPKLGDTVPPATPDNRLYALTGKMTIEDKPYSINMKYAQKQTEAGRFIAMAGTVNTPSVKDVSVKISTEGLDLLSGDFSADTSRMISLDSSGKWISGGMKMETTKAEEIKFNADGSAKLSEGDAVPDWQNAFNFLK